ncbi:tyrosine-protein phosphatase [Sphingobium sp. HBC34]|uniref:Tyrosine-protein phosphatase n=1 Tax=Sphingobium cyanobacteriorum TaxID=3063954 RepID=A0ABT8ZPL4_9SPHN|nr:tyrosine-protein phosphatase [Sphingobium sp. HBC34]MDO7836479.1 tyrosine-protein phosphatase [Sphingobium sp. HBC34]
MVTSVNVVDADRIISLEGAQNFREIGGYPTGDGRRLKRGMLWRSAKLDELTGEDVEVIRALGIKTIADLRRRSERESSPTHEAIVTGSRVLAWDAQFARDEQESGKLFLSGATSEDYFEALLGLYRLLPEEHSLHLSELYQAVSEGALPILIHCAAGKDRTGIAVGILLDLLGVERSYVMADYAKTEQLLDWTRLKKSAAMGAGVSNNWLERLDPLALQLLMRSDERYLAATFDAIEQRYGSSRNFLTDRLKLPADVIEKMRDYLLEPV